MKCEYCGILDRESKAEILYQDDQVVAALKDTVVLPGQVTVFPKEHFTIMEMVPEDILKKCSVMANKIGAAVFESLGAQGTNIVVQNGLGAGQKVPHFAIEVIPRNESDGLDLQWKTKQLMEDEIESVFKILKEEADKIDLSRKENSKKDKIKKNGEEVIVKDGDTEMKVKKDKGENYLLKSLRRVP